MKSIPNCVSFPSRWISRRNPFSGKLSNRHSKTNAVNYSSLFATIQPIPRWHWSPSKPEISKQKTLTANRVINKSTHFKLNLYRKVGLIDCVCFYLNLNFIHQILTSRCGSILVTNEWRNAKRPSTSAHWSRCLTRRSPSTCRGKRSANVR